VNISAFGTFFANAFNRTFDPPFDPFANDVNLVLAIWSLEEIGSTGDKVRQPRATGQPFPAVCPPS
jgi:hypothetical protein